MYVHKFVQTSNCDTVINHYFSQLPQGTGIEPLQDKMVSHIYAIFQEIIVRLSPAGATVRSIYTRLPFSLFFLFFQLFKYQWRLAKALDFGNYAFY